jgi:hypothetical protein
MALPRGKKRRLATQAEKNRARQNGETVPTYVIVDIATSGSSDSGSSSCSSDSSSYSSSSSSDSGGGSCDSGGGF